MRTRTLCLLFSLFSAVPALAQDAGKVYLAEYSGSPTLRVVDVDTAVVSLAVPLQLAWPTDFASAPDGRLYATTASRLYTIDPANGQAALVGDMQLTDVVGLEFDCGGGGFIVTWSGHFASIDLQTGATQVIDSYPVTFSGDVATRGFDEFFATFNGAGESHLARIEVTPGGTVFTDLGVPVPGRRLLGLDFDGFGRLIASDESNPGGQLHEILGWGGAGPVQSLPLVTVSGLNSGIAGIASFVASGQQQEYCVASTNSCGTTPTLTASGLASATATSGFVLSAHDLPGQRFAALLLSTAGRTSVPFGSGTLCLQAPSFVAVQRASGTAGLCDGVVSVDVNALAGPTFLDQPGTLVQAQFLGRDGASAALTQAIEFSICD
jgi:hypothetical protein